MYRKDTEDKCTLVVFIVLTFLADTPHDLRLMPASYSTSIFF